MSRVGRGGGWSFAIDCASSEFVAEHVAISESNSSGSGSGSTRLHNIQCSSDKPGRLPCTHRAPVAQLHRRLEACGAGRHRLAAAA